MTSKLFESKENPAHSILYDIKETHNKLNQLSISLHNTLKEFDMNLEYLNTKLDYLNSLLNTNETLPKQYRIQYQLQQHDDIITSLYILHDGRLVSASDDCSISIWNTSTRQCELILTGHTEGVVKVIQLSDGRLCSCSYDKTIRLWNMQSGECLAILQGHNDTVTAVIQLQDGRVCSSSYDNTLKIFNLESGECEVTLTGHSSQVNDIVQLRDGRIISGSTSDSRLLIHDLKCNSCETTTLNIGSGIVSLLSIDDTKICCSLLDGRIKIVNTIDFSCEQTFEDTSSISCCKLLNDGRIAVGKCSKVISTIN
jgi:WD40 repeat protein